MDKKQLKEAGLKITTPRLKILEVLENSSKRHMRAEEIHQELEKNGVEAGLATVYRALVQFEEAGLVIRHNFEEGYSVFELDRGDHHDHLVCVKCHKVVEFHDEIIEDRQRDIAAQHGFQMTDHSLNIYGFCQKCQ
ncbi:MAG: ferric iron uptake transcriptional regulator [Gammaproteobacteria bacterium]